MRKLIFIILILLWSGLAISLMDNQTDQGTKTAVQEMNTKRLKN